MREERTAVDRTTVDWKAVVLFYVLACALSWPFFWWRDMHRASWIAWSAPRYLKASFYMWGPGLAALVALYVFRRRHVRTITFLGRWPAVSVAFYLVPLAALGLAYAPELGRRALLVPGIGALSLFNILGEELGWRGFLQDALRPLPRLQRYVLLGAMWEFWHFTARTSSGSAPQIAMRLAIMYPLTILLTAIIGELTDRTRALLVAVTLHFWLDALWEVPQLLHAPPVKTYVVFGASILFWAVTLYTLRRRPALPGAELSAVS